MHAVVAGAVFFELFGMFEKIQGAEGVLDAQVFGLVGLVVEKLYASFFDLLLVESFDDFFVCIQFELFFHPFQFFFFNSFSLHFFRSSLFFFLFGSDNQDFNAFFDIFFEGVLILNKHVFTLSLGFMKLILPSSILKSS